MLARCLWSGAGFFSSLLILVSFLSAFWLTQLIEEHRQKPALSYSGYSTSMPILGANYPRIEFVPTQTTKKLFYRTYFAAQANSITREAYSDYLF